MATELDALQLNFSASTSGAETSIQRLINKLNSLSSAIGIVNSANFVSNAENIVQSMNDIKRVAESTNSAELKNIASGIRALTNATKNVSDGENVKAYLSNVASGLNTLANTNVNLSGITNMLNSMNRLGNSGNIANAGNSISRIADGIKSFEGITIPTLNVSDLASSLRSLGSKSIVNAAANISAIVPQLKELQNLSLGNVAGLTELAQALSVFGRATSQKALDTNSIERFAKAFKNLITTLASAPAISRGVIDLANALAQFLANLNRVGSGSTNASRGLNIFSATTRSTTKSTFSLARAIGKLYANYFLLFRAFRLVGKSIDISADLKEVQNVVDTAFGDMTDKMEEFAKTSVEMFGLSELSAKRYGSRFQAMGTAMGISSKSIEKAQQQLNKINPTLAERNYSDTADSMADLSINITKLTGDLASFYNVAQEDVAKDLESIFTGSTRPLNLAA